VSSKEGDALNLREWRCVIEVENNRIALAAIDTGVCAQELQYPREVGQTTLAHLHLCTRDVLVSMSLVVPSPVRRLTCAAVRLSATVSNALERERRDGFLKPAERATLPDRGRLTAAGHSDYSRNV
jgi:hypothetical protein